MAEAQKKADYFGTFLDHVESQQSVPEGVENDRLVRLLRALSEESRRPIAELQKAADLPFTEFSAELQTAQEAGYVDVTGSSGEEIVELTESGKVLASRLRQP